MKIKIITEGYVEQIFNTITNKFESSKFVAGDISEEFDIEGNYLTEEESDKLEDNKFKYMGFDMVQPVEYVWLVKISEKYKQDEFLCFSSLGLVESFLDQFGDLIEVSKTENFYHYINRYGDDIILEEHFYIAKIELDKT